MWSDHFILELGARPLSGLRQCVGRLAIVVGLAISGPAAAQNATYDPRNTYGEVGILEIPSARMADDGELSLTVGTLQNAQRVNFSFQALPWLAGTFRYSHIPDVFGKSDYYDRSIGMKIRLWQEGEWRPEVSLGFRDFIGTNFYGAEYLVVSKTIFDSIDLTGGIGWGRLGESATFPNPFAQISPSFKTRDPPSGVGGDVDFGQFFHGANAGIFGGVVWRTPIPDIDFLLEYSGDRYTTEIAEGGNFQTRSPIDIGLSYRPLSNVTLSAGWMYGTTWGATLTFALDPKHPLSPEKLDTPPPPPVVRPVAARQAANPQNVPPPDPQVKSVERFRDTLLVEVEAAERSAIHCGTLASNVSRATIGIRTVAITDMSDPKGAVIICSGPKVTEGADAAPSPEVRDDDDATTTPRPLATPDTTDSRQTIFNSACEQGLSILSTSEAGSTITIYFANGHYLSEAEAAGRLVRVLMAAVPTKVESFVLIDVKGGVAQRRIVLSRNSLENLPPIDAGAFLRHTVRLDMPPLGNVSNDMAQMQCPAPAQSWSPMAGNNENGEVEQSDAAPFSWSIVPQWQLSLFDPIEPLEYSVYVAAGASVTLWPGLTASGTADVNVYNNFRANQFNDSQLPHVRSDIGKYVKQGGDGIANLQLTYTSRLSDDVFARVKTGYLESMFFGGGGEFLWRPDGPQYALGADLYYVVQRGFDRLFDLRNYRTLTGHVSLYYQSPWYGLNFNVHAGRYLAGDYGATIEVTRRFLTGVQIGAFATFTNVPFSKFGEGSFDKGILITVPFEWGLPYHTQSTFDLPLHSLTRDGGQRLLGDDSLYPSTSATGYYEIEEHMDDIANP